MAKIKNNLKTKKSNRIIFRVIKLKNKWYNNKWVVKVNKAIDGWTLDDSAKNKSQAINLAFSHAKKVKGAIVIIFDYKNHLQVEISHRVVLNYIPKKS